MPTSSLLDLPASPRPVRRVRAGLGMGAGLGLALLLGAWVAGCRSEATAPPPPGPVDRLAEEIRRIVPASERQRRLLAIVEEVEALQEQCEIDAAAIRRRWRTLNSDYDATAADLSEVLAESRMRRHVHLSAVAELRVEAASLLTVEEWRRIASRRHAARDFLLGL